VVSRKVYESKGVTFEKGFLSVFLVLIYIFGEITIRNKPSCIHPKIWVDLRNKVSCINKLPASLPQNSAKKNKNKWKTKTKLYLENLEKLLWKF
jgi:hypothetical protein